MTEEQKKADRHSVDKRALDAVAEAVQTAHEITGEAATLTKPDVTDAVVEDFGKLSAEPLLKYAEAAAVHIEQAGQAIAEEGAKLHNDCIQLAGDIRDVARKQAEAIRRSTNRTRKAASAVTKIRDEFHADIKAEIEQAREIRNEIEAEVQKARTG